MKKKTKKWIKSGVKWQWAAGAQSPFQRVYLFGQTRSNVGDTADE